MSLDTAGLTASVFLDQYGRYAKRPEDVYEVRLFYVGDSCLPVSLTKAQYTALSAADKAYLNTVTGAPQCINTEGKSNA